MSGEERVAYGLKDQKIIKPLIMKFNRFVSQAVTSLKKQKINNVWYILAQLEFHREGKPLFE